MQQNCNNIATVWHLGNSDNIIATVWHYCTRWTRRTKREHPIGCNNV